MKTGSYFGGPLRKPTSWQIRWSLGASVVGLYQQRGRRHGTPDWGDQRARSVRAWRRCSPSPLVLAELSACVAIAAAFAPESGRCRRSPIRTPDFWAGRRPARRRFSVRSGWAVDQAQIVADAARRVVREHPPAQLSRCERPRCHVQPSACKRRRLGRVRWSSAARSRSGCDGLQRRSRCDGLQRRCHHLEARGDGRAAVSWIALAITGFLCSRRGQCMTALRARLDDGMEGDEGGDSGRGVVSESAGASAWAGCTHERRAASSSPPHS